MIELELLLLLLLIMRMRIKMMILLNQEETGPSTLMPTEYYYLLSTLIEWRGRLPSQSQSHCSSLYVTGNKDPKLTIWRVVSIWYCILEQKVTSRSIQDKKSDDDTAQVDSFFFFFFSRSLPLLLEQRGSTAHILYTVNRSYDVCMCMCMCRTLYEFVYTVHKEKNDTHQH